MDKKTKHLGILLTVLGGICWGISGCFGQYLFTEKGISSVWLVNTRLIWAGLSLVVLGYLKDKKELFRIFKDKASCKELLIFSFFGMLLCQYTYFGAVEQSNAGTATVLQSLNVVVILLFLCLREKRKPRSIEVGCIVTALAGIFLLSTGGNWSNMNLSQAALGFGLSSAFATALYNVLSGHIMRKFGVYSVVGFSMLISGVCLLFPIRYWSYEITYDKSTILALLGVIIIGTSVAFSLYLKGVSIVGAFMGSLLGTVEPLAAIVVSCLCLGATFSLVECLGFALILGTVCVLSLSKQTQPKPAKAPQACIMHHS